MPGVLITNSQSGPSIRLFVAATTTALRFVVTVEEVEPASVVSVLTSRTCWISMNPVLVVSGLSSLIAELPPRLIPNGNDGGPLPALLVKLSARTLPPLEGSGATSVPMPNISAMKSSPSATMKSAPSSTASSEW